ncbi:hypothetical protein ACTFIV_004111 [Dictyostelium citrinum]
MRAKENKNTVFKRDPGELVLEIEVVLKKDFLNYPYQKKLYFLKYLKKVTTVLTKEHYLIIKRGFESHFNDLNPSEIPKIVFDFMAIHIHYFYLTHSESEVESFYLSLLKPIIVVDSLYKKPSLSHTLYVLGSNQHCFTLELTNKIVKVLIDNITNYDLDESFFVVEYLFLTIKLILSSKQQQQQQQQQSKEFLLKEENKIKEYVNSETFKTKIIKELKLTAQSQPLETFDVSSYIFESIQQQNTDLYSLLLYYEKWYSCLPPCLKTYKNQIIESICKDKNGMIFPKNFSLKKEKFSSILSFLIDYGQFSFNIFTPLLHCLNQLNINKTSTSNYLFEIFRDEEISMGYDIVIQFMVLLKKEFPALINRKQISYCVRFLFSNPSEYDTKLKSVLRICEDKFINQLGQDEYMLFEIYSKHLDFILKGHQTSSPEIEFLLEDYIFYNIEKSTIKKSLIKKKFNYFIQVLNINSINRYLLPIFREKCEGSKIYQLKLNISSFSSSSSFFKINPILQNTLLKEIIYHYVECKSTTIFQILQLSLVSKKTFSFVKSFINDSTNFLIAFSDFLSMGIISPHQQNISSLLLFNPSLIKNLKINICTENLIPKQLLDSCESLEKLHLVYNEKLWPHTFEYLNYRLSNPQNKLKKITITYPKKSIWFDIHIFQKGIQFLINKYGKEIEISIEIDYLLIKTSSVPLKISGYNRLTTQIEDLNEIVNNLSAKNLELQIINDYGSHGTRILNEIDSIKCVDELSLQLLESLEFKIIDFEHSCGYDVLLRLLDFFGNIITSNLKEIIISKKKTKPESIKFQTQVLLKLISNDPRFNNVEKVTVKNFYSPSFPHWKSINSHSFLQSPFSSNSIEFIRKPQQFTITSNSNKRKFNEIEPLNLSNQNNDDDDEFIIPLNN